MIFYEQEQLSVQLVGIWTVTAMFLMTSEAARVSQERGGGLSQKAKKGALDCIVHNFLRVCLWAGSMLFTTHLHFDPARSSQKLKEEITMGASLVVVYFITLALLGSVFGYRVVHL